MAAHGIEVGVPWSVLRGPFGAPQDEGVGLQSGGKLAHAASTEDTSNCV